MEIPVVLGLLKMGIKFVGCRKPCMDSNSRLVLGLVDSTRLCFPWDIDRVEVTIPCPLSIS